jgi:hypothetical protein
MEAAFININCLYQKTFGTLYGGKGSPYFQTYYFTLRGLRLGPHFKSGEALKIMPLPYIYLGQWIKCRVKPQGGRIPQNKRPSRPRAGYFGNAPNETAT